jgi:hypothetical protein
VKLVLGRALFGRGPAEFDEFRFTVKPVREWRRYVVDEERERLQAQAAPAQARSIEENKVLFWNRCLEAGLPTAPITAVVRPGHGPVPGHGVPVARTGAELREVLEAGGDLVGFAKPVGGGDGYGAFSFHVRGGTVGTPDWEGKPEAFFDRCTALPSSQHGYLLQPHLRAHPELAPVMPGPGLGTIRLVSFLDPGGTVEIPWIVLKVPGRGQVLDKVRLGAGVAPVDPSTGSLGPAVGRTREIPVFHEMERHPETGARFCDVAIPHWQEVLPLVVRAARAFAELPCLGWDVVVTDRGVFLLETNWNFGMHNQQIALNRGLGPDLRRYFARCVPQRA